jgi:hypothetical protein
LRPERHRPDSEIGPYADPAHAEPSEDDGYRSLRASATGLFSPRRRRKRRWEGERERGDVDGHGLSVAVDCDLAIPRDRSRNRRRDEMGAGIDRKRRTPRIPLDGARVEAKLEAGREPFESD